MKTGIMGGTFNPIHNGHLILAGHVMDEFGLDEIWFMPNGNPPHKQPEKTGAGMGDRLGSRIFPFSLMKWKRIRFPIPMKQWNISKTLSRRGSSSIL